MNKSFKVIDLSGYSFSGKSAVYDLLSEFNGCRQHGKNFEFELLRVQNGILDLYNDLVKNWSPVRSSEAIRSFNKLVKAYRGGNSVSSRLTRMGHKYDMFFPGFTSLSLEYVKTLTIATWKSEWPFAFDTCSMEEIFFRKVLFRLGYTSIFETDVFLSRFEKKEFIDITKKYLNQLFLS